MSRGAAAGMVNTYPKTAWSRSSVEGIQQAMVDVMLLSSCPVLIGTYYSSYSETAKLIGRPFYIQARFACCACQCFHHLARAFELACISCDKNIAAYFCGVSQQCFLK